jgi:uncharacterized protein YggE
MPVVNKQKDWFWLILNIALAVVILLGLASLQVIYRYGKSLPASRTITVSAEGKTVVLPDIASFSFSVVNEGSDPEKIAEKNNVVINEALGFIKEKGVEDKDIKTSGYDLSPRYEYDEKRKTSFISGYRLTQTVTVKIRDFSKISQILGALPGFGINQIGSLSFSVDDPDVYLNKAREQAFQKARVKAEAMAKQNKTKIERVVTFSEFSGGYPMPIFAKATTNEFNGAAVSPQIEPGSQEVTVNVSVTYEIR